MLRVLETGQFYEREEAKIENRQKRGMMSNTLMVSLRDRPRRLALFRYPGALSSERSNAKTKVDRGLG